MKLKLIKEKAFTVDTETHTHYTVAYKGRVFGLSTLRFPKENITVNDSVVTITGEVEVLKNQTVDQLTGEIKMFLDIVPKLDIALAVI